MTDPSQDRLNRLRDALEAARRAGNPTLVASIEAAMRGEDYDPFTGLNIHPEMRGVLGLDD